LTGLKVGDYIAIDTSTVPWPGSSTGVYEFVIARTTGVSYSNGGLVNVERLIKVDKAGLRGDQLITEPADGSAAAPSLCGEGGAGICQSDGDIYMIDATATETIAVQVLPVADLVLQATKEDLAGTPLLVLPQQSIARIMEACRSQEAQMRREFRARFRERRERQSRGGGQKERALCQARHK
jgi:hypothetical protein